MKNDKKALKIYQNHSRGHRTVKKPQKNFWLPENQLCAERSNDRALRLYNVSIIID